MLRCPIKHGMPWTSYDFPMLLLTSVPSKSHSVFSFHLQNQFNQVHSIFGNFPNLDRKRLQGGVGKLKKGVERNVKIGAT